MPLAVEIHERLKEVFTEKQAVVLTKVITSSYEDIVKTRDFNEHKTDFSELKTDFSELKTDFSELKTDFSELKTDFSELKTDFSELKTDFSELKTDFNEHKRDFNKHKTDFHELKEIVRELALAQKRTEVRVEELAQAQKESQKELCRLDKIMQKLAESQNRTEVEIQKLTKAIKETRGELGGLSKSVSYAFENEAYRMLPSVLKEKYGIEVKEKFIRTEIGDKEINILGKARRDDKNILIVGETKLRLDEKRKKIDVFKELEEKVSAVKEKYKEEIVRVLITHYATNGFMKEAKEHGVIVIQSFEW